MSEENIIQDPGAAPPESAPATPQQYVRPPRTRRDRWPWVSLLPLGLGSWAPMIAGARCRVPAWGVGGFAGILSCITGFVLAGNANRIGHVNQTEGAVAGLLLIASWAGGVIISFGIRPSYDVLTGFDPPRTSWPTPTPRSLQWSVRYAVVAYVAAFLFVLLLGLLFDDLLNVNITVGIGVLMVDATLLCALIPLARRLGMSLPDLGLRRTPSMPSLGLVIQGAVAYLVLAALYAIAFIGLSTKQQANQISSQINQLHGASLVVAILAISISAPVVEEVFFRGLVYRSLRNRLSVLPAALIAGVMFGFVHITGYPLVTLPVKALFGVIACLLYERTGSLLPGIALHSLVDATSVDLSLTGNDWIVFAVFASVAGVIVIRFALQRLGTSGTSSSPPLASATG